MSPKSFLGAVLLQKLKSAYVFSLRLKLFSVHHQFPCAAYPGTVYVYSEKTHRYLADRIGPKHS